MSLVNVTTSPWVLISDIRARVCMIVVLCSLTCFLPCFFRGIYLHNPYLYKCISAGESGRVITVVGRWGTPTFTFKKRRRYRKRITFTVPFSTTPTVINAIGALVNYHSGIIDVGSFIRNVGRSGFDLNVEDSTDSIVHYVFTSWMACS